MANITKLLVSECRTNRFIEKLTPKRSIVRALDQWLEPIAECEGDGESSVGDKCNVIYLITFR